MKNKKCVHCNGEGCIELGLVHTSPCPSCGGTKINQTPMENIHIELLAKATDLTQDEIQADLIKPEYETPFQVISVHSALTALQALETALTEKHRAEVEGLRNATIEECKDALLKHLAPVTYNNGYPIQAVAQSTILSLPALMKTTNPKEERK